jgi:ubiquinone/menaquinone biosynthesis C-methylase UbiE
MMIDIEQQLQETRQYWDNEAVTFDNEPDHGLRDPVVREAWTNLLVNSLPSPPASVLDIGCGTGSLSILLAGLNYAVTGIDLSEVMIARAKAKTKTAGYSIRFRVMDASNPDFSSQKFDVIVCRHLLWTLPEPALALQRWSKILVPGGRLVLIEGYWHTGVGLQSQQVIDTLPSTFTAVTAKNLSDHPNLWGGEVTDERYIVIADQSANKGNYCFVGV